MGRELRLNSLCPNGIFSLCMNRGRDADVPRGLLGRFSAPVRSSMPVPVSVMSIFNLAAKTKDTGKEAEDTGSFSSFSALLKK